MVTNLLPPQRKRNMTTHEDNQFYMCQHIATFITHLWLSPKITFCTFPNCHGTSLNYSEANLQVTFWLDLYATMPSLRPIPCFISWSEVWMIYTELPNSAPSAEVTVNKAEPRELSNMIWVIQQKMAQCPYSCGHVWICACTCLCFTECVHIKCQKEWSKQSYVMMRVCECVFVCELLS